METRSSRKLFTSFSRWIFPLHRWWKPLQWIWGVLVLGVVINIGSSWLITRTLDLRDTPLEGLVSNISITLPLGSVLILLTMLASLAHHQADVLVIQTEQSVTLTSQQRLQVIHSLQHEYGNRLAHSLQGRVALKLGLHERTDMVASSAQLVFHHTDIATEYSLPADTSITEVYDNAQRGLLLMGAPGSGKTTLLVELAMELLQRAENDPKYPIPIILNLSSWGTRKLAFLDWLKEQLSLVYGIREQVSASWIASDQVIFLLDGLNEVEATTRSACINTVNAYRQEHLVPLVVCSRSREYEEQQARLSLPIAVEIQPLELERVRTYLKQVGKPLAAVHTALLTNPVLQQLLTAPLMLSIVFFTYRDKAVKDLPQMGSAEEQQRQIFENYVQRMLQRHQHCRAFSETQCTRSLIWLAQQMQQHHVSEFYLESLQVDWLRTKRSQYSYRLSVGLLFGLATGLVAGLGTGLILGFLAGPGTGLTFGLGTGLIFGLITGIVREQVGKGENIQLAEQFAWSWKESYKGGIGGLVCGIYLGLVFQPLAGMLWGPPGVMGIGKTTGLFGELTAGLLLGLTGGLMGGVIKGLSSSSLKSGIRLRPNQGIYHTGWNAFRFSLAFLLLTAFIFGQTFGFIFGQTFEWITGLHVGLRVGLTFGLGTGLALGLSVGLKFGGLAYFQHYLLRFFLAACSDLPWNAVPLLEEATSCILLQRVGSGYRFVHPLLQEYFASLATSPLAP